MKNKIIEQYLKKIDEPDKYYVKDLLNQKKYKTAQKYLFKKKVNVPALQWIKNIEKEKLKKQPEIKKNITYTIQSKDVYGSIKGEKYKSFYEVYDVISVYDIKNYKIIGSDGKDYTINFFGFIKKEHIFRKNLKPENILKQLPIKLKNFLTKNSKNILISTTDAGWKYKMKISYGLDEYKRLLETNGFIKIAKGFDGNFCFVFDTKKNLIYFMDSDEIFDKIKPKMLFKTFTVDGFIKFIRIEVK